MQSTVRTRAQEMAGYALGCVQRFREEGSGNQKNYQGYAQKLPAMVMTNGLAATLAYMREKGSEWEVLYTHLAGWFRRAGMLHNGRDLLETVVSLSSAEYRHWSREALAVAEWFKRLAKVILKTDKGESQ